MDMMKQTAILKIRLIVFIITLPNPFIGKKYRCRTQRRYRAVAGQSIGGGGALFYALHQPEMFSAAAALGAVTGRWSQEE